MDPITTGLLTNLLAAGLLNRVEAGHQKLHAVFQEAEFDAEIDAIETEFHLTLRDAIEDCDAKRESDELAEIVGHWGAVVEQLAATTDEASEGATDRGRLIFANEQEAIDRLAREIAAARGYELGTNPQLQQALKRAVAEAYAEAVALFGERLVDTGLDDQFVTEANIEELAALDQLQNRLENLEERLTHPRFYELYRGDADGRRRASRMIDPQAFEFVSRPELEEYRAAQRLLVLGPGGSGKSRVIAELVANADAEIEHIIRPKAALQTSHDLKPLRSESFQGDVLLVWDDIHAISPETGNTVFRKAITELETFLAPEHDLHVLAAARSNHVDSLPGTVGNSDPLWSAFEIIELEDLSEEAIETLFDRVVAKEGVVAAEDVRTAFVEKAQVTDPSPLYVASVVETVDGVQLTSEDIEVLPEDALTIWQEQYKAIKAANDERRFVLWAVKLLAELRSPPFHHSLLKGIYAHVLDRDELTFGPPVDDLCQHQWLVPRVDAQGETRYIVHDVKVEAIDESIDGRLRAYSTFLFEEVERYLPTTEGVEHRLHENFAATLQNRDLIWDTQLVEQHCERALTLDPNCNTAHHSYGIILKNTLGRPEKAKEHFEQALAIDPELAEVHNSYADLLNYELDRPERAKEHYEQSLSIDPDDALAHESYAILLYHKLSAPEAAKEHFERALAIDSELAEVHYNYATVLSDAFDAPEEAKEHLEQALSLGSEDATTHYNYAKLLQSEFGELEEAKEHYERALNIDSKFAEAHTNYAGLLCFQFDQIEDAKRHYEQALSINPNLGPALNNYAILLRYELDAPKEAQHYFERGIAITDEPMAHLHYGNLLFEEFDALEEAKSHLERALQALQEMDAIANELDALRELVRVYLALDDESTALEYCEQALELSPNDPDDVRWFEGVHALLMETGCQTPYTDGLTAVLGKDHDHASDLFELVWTNRDKHSPTSDSHDMALSAGVALAVLARHDGASSQTCEEILTSIEPSSLSPPASILYERLDTGTAELPDISSTDAPHGDLPLQTLERQAVAHLLDQLSS